MKALVTALLVAFGGVGAVTNAAATAPTFHPRYRIVGHLAGLSTNWLYTVLWSRQLGVIGTVIDERTGRRTELLLPAPCADGPSAPMLGDSWLLVDCSRAEVDLYSPATAQWHAVTAASACRNFRSSAGGCIPVDVGTDWIEYDEQSTRLGDRFIFQNIATGAVRRDPRNQRTVVNLDSPVLAQKVCAPLSVPRYTGLTFDGRFAVATGPSGRFLERCGTRLHLPLPYGDIALAPGALVAVGRPTDAFSGIFLPSLKRFSIAPPPGHPDVVGVDLSLRHIYVAGLSRSGIPDVWSAPTPVPPAAAARR